MAEFAKIGLNNRVLNIVTMTNLHTMSENGTLEESIGQEKLKGETGHETWLLCGKDLQGNVIRKNIPGIDWIYSSEHDGFHQPRPNDIHGLPCNSWSLNPLTCRWDSPLEKPLSYFLEASVGIATTVGGCGGEISFWWDEDLYQSDNTKGWVRSDSISLTTD